MFFFFALVPLTYEDTVCCINRMETARTMGQSFKIEKSSFFRFCLLCQRPIVRDFGTLPHMHMKSERCCLTLNCHSISECCLDSASILGAVHCVLTGCPSTALQSRRPCDEIDLIKLFAFARISSARPWVCSNGI